jgi:MoxR-like ATPase
MAIIDQFKVHVEQFDLDTVFEQTAARGRVINELEKGEVFGPYQHRLDTDSGWINDNWQTGADYGYEYALPNGDHIRTALDCDSVLTSLAKIPYSKDPFVTLYSSRGWNIGRGGDGIKSVLGIDNWNDFDAQLCMETLNKAIAEIRGFNPRTTQCGKFFNDLTSANRWRGDLPYTTVLFHLVWPQFYPVWYRTTNDSYSQLVGIDKLLDALSDGLKLNRKPLHLYKNYADYAAAYRVLLLAYHRFVWAPPAGPRHVPHFDFLTQLLAELDAQAEATKMLLISKALVLYGVPGTGKTHAAVNELGPAVAANIHRVQFHPGYSYADFLIGIHPHASGGTVTYPVIPGVLYRLAAEAAIGWGERQQSRVKCQNDADSDDQQEEKASRFVLVIDEINRADLAKILGEAMYLLEYRGKENTISLPHEMNGSEGVTSVFNVGRKLCDPFDEGRHFYFPENLYVIGTMNHADRSISGFDMALRRRFAWAKLDFSPGGLRRMLTEWFNKSSITVRNLEGYVRRCSDLNRRIENSQEEHSESTVPFNADHVLGHTYFAEIAKIVAERTSPNRETTITPADLERLWLYHLRPLLEDYLGYEVHNYKSGLNRLRDRFIAN